MGLSRTRRTVYSITPASTFRQFRYSAPSPRTVAEFRTRVEGVFNGISYLMPLDASSREDLAGRKPSLVNGIQYRALIYPSATEKVAGFDASVIDQSI